MKTWWNILICMWTCFIHGAVNANGEFKLTSSPLPATDGEVITLICSFSNESIVNIGWLQNNKPKVVSQKTANCDKQALAYGQDIINRINVSCNSTAHSIEFRFNSTTDQGSAWQCGGIFSETAIYPRSNNYTIGTEEDNQTSSPVMSTQSLSPTTRYTEIKSDPNTVPPKKGTEEGNQTSSPVMSTQPLSTTTRYRETKSDPNTVPPKKVTGEKDSNLLYIVVGAVGGAVLLAVVVVGVVCIRQRRKAAHQQNDMKEERNKKASSVYQNTTGNNTVENDLYEGSRDVQPMNAAENQEDDFMLSDAYASVDMPVTNMCTPREEVPFGDVNLENLYAKPDKNKHTEVQHVSDIYAVVQKPKKKKQDPMVSEDFNTGDVYAKPNKGLTAHK